MDMAERISILKGKDNAVAFVVLQETERLSEETDLFYADIEQFIEMMHSEKYVIRVRGFRLCCKQAKWDSKGVIDENIEEILQILNDEKPTAVRQALAALQDLVLYKKELNETIKKHVLAIDYLRYKETMHSLIAKDIHVLIDKMDEK